MYEDDGCNGELDHAVTIVGYKKKKGKDVWIIKNRRVHSGIIKNRLVGHSDMIKNRRVGHSAVTKNRRVHTGIIQNNKEQPSRYWDNKEQAST